MSSPHPRLRGRRAKVLSHRANGIFSCTLTKCRDHRKLFWPGFLHRRGPRDTHTRPAPAALGRGSPPYDVQSSQTPKRRQAHSASAAQFTIASSLAPPSRSRRRAFSARGKLILHTLLQRRGLRSLGCLRCIPIRTLRAIQRSACRIDRAPPRVTVAKRSALVTLSRTTLV